jgi:molybdopterin molybdotransferase
MSDASGHELDLQAAVGALCAELAPITQRESASSDVAAGRVLAADVIATVDLPRFANAAMDGYAVRSSDCQSSARLRVVGTALAGHGFAGELPPHSAVRIMTGAPIPDGADAVVMQEEATWEGDLVLFSSTARAGQYVRPRGEHVRAGDVVVAARTTLGAAEIGLVTAVGVTQVEVRRRLCVGVASTGDELADPPTPLSSSGSYDGNRPLLVRACHAAGFDANDLGICRDNAADFTRLIDRAREASLDALVISGGSALGDADVVRKSEEVRFLPLNIGPGRGITFGKFGDDAARLALIGLPGNAVSSFVMFHLIALPALRYLAGGVAQVPVHVPVPLAVELACKPGRVDYRRGRYESDPSGRLLVRPLAQQGAGMLRTLVEAEVLIAAGPKPRYNAGEPILTVPLAVLPH